jgi:hypothetical protein
MQRDILFFAKKLPVQYLPRSANFFMVPWGPLFSPVQNLSEKLASLKSFIAGLNGDTLVACGIRNDCESESESINTASEELEKFLSPYSFLTQEVFAEVSNVVLVREGSSDDVYPRVLQKSGWIRWTPKEAPVSDVSMKRNETISEYLLKYFAHSSSKDPDLQTGLVEQLQFSLNMFRCGFTARSLSAEFICKFVALDGLVGGESRHNSRNAVLETRLCALCENSLPKVDELVSELCKRRNAIAHHARVNRHVILSHMDALDRMVLAAFVFAVDHLEQANSVEQLWTHVSTYQLPPAVFELTTAGEVRAAILHGVVDPHLVWRGIGKSIDALYYREPNPS